MSKKKGSKKARKAAANATTTAGTGLFGNLGAWMREHPSEQFLLGTALGAAIVYVLSNEELRGKILKGGVELYGAVAGGLAELREQVADIKAEVDLEKARDADAA